VNVVVPAPPEGALSLFTDEPRRLAELAPRSTLPHTHVVDGGAPLGCRRWALHDEPGMVCWHTAAVPWTVRGELVTPVIHVIQSGAGRYVVGRQRIEATAGDVMLIPAHVSVTIRWQPMRALAVQLPADALADALRARRPRGRGTERVALSRLPVDVERGAALSKALADYVQALAAEDPSLPETRAAVAAWIADAAVAGEAIVPVQPLRAARAQRLEAWIDAHLTDPITLDRLCGIAGVGGRCLQKTFEVRHGTSPLEFVMQRRLAAARERLLRAPNGAQVIDIALDVGVTHMGRFAQRYRTTFGELPSATLRRRHVESNRASR
jgi:AraC-like DNA-binding protein